jgi:hypothetical protein
LAIRIVITCMSNIYHVWVLGGSSNGGHPNQWFFPGFSLIFR